MGGCFWNPTTHALVFARDAIVDARAPLAAAKAVTQESRDAMTRAVGALGILKDDELLRSPVPLAASAAVQQAARVGNDAPWHCVDGLLARAQEQLDGLTRNYGTPPHSLLDCPEYGDASLVRGELTPVRGEATRFAANEKLADSMPAGPNAASHVNMDPLGQRWGSITDLERAGGVAARDDLAEVFAPLAHDVLRQVRMIRDVPLDQLPRAGKDITLRAPMEMDLGREMALENIGIFMDDIGEHLRPAPGGAMRSSSGMPGEISEPGLFAQATVGEYGPKVATALVDAARIMNAQMRQAIDPIDARALGESRQQLLGRFAFQKTDVRRAFVEGINSFPDAYGSLMANRVGDLTAPQLLDAIEQSRVIDRMAKLPNGVTAPLSNEQLLPTHSLELLKGGRVKLGASWDRVADSVRAHQETKRTAFPTTGAGCPIVKRLERLPVDTGDGPGTSESYLTVLNREYVHLVQRLLDEAA